MRSNDAPARVVDDLLHNTLDVAIAFREVEGAELGRSLVVVRVGLELEAGTKLQQMSDTGSERDVR